MAKTLQSKSPGLGTSVLGAGAVLCRRDGSLKEVQKIKRIYTGMVQHMLILLLLRSQQPGE